MNTATQAKPNHLAGEKSPYLLLHVTNPVDWYPWGENAFKKARVEDKPIFLSIGYATCHWCHVMERESFSHPKIAEILNSSFVSIKVDREELPEVDKIYMTAVQSMTGGGGWPLSVWLTPELKPFTGGTYFPRESRDGRPGLLDVLAAITDAWRNDRKGLLNSSVLIQQDLGTYLNGKTTTGRLEKRLLDQGFLYLKQSYDEEWGGFGTAPKFPMPINLHFLLRFYARTKNESALQMASLTLRQMAMGGLYDQLGGGFHRYSTDSRWQVPHFEKMLYDNAQLIAIYLKAHQITTDETFKKVAEETLAYVLRDMTHPDGGFYSAEDADSLDPTLGEAKEGAFYLWTEEEIHSLLVDDIADVVLHYYGVASEGNVERDPQREFEGKNILHVEHGIDETALKFNRSRKEIQTILAQAKRALFEKRAGRPRPFLDDKIIVSWNGLMISALATSHQVLNRPQHLDAAQKAADFILAHIYDRNSRTLFRRWRDGEKKGEALAEDYAFLIQGLLDLTEAATNTAWLTWAGEMMETMNQLFFDQTNGGYYMTAVSERSDLIVRPKDGDDNVQPSASSVAVLNLIRLGHIQNRQTYLEMAEQTLMSAAPSMDKFPGMTIHMLSALDAFLPKTEGGD